MKRTKISQKYHYISAKVNSFIRLTDRLNTRVCSMGCTSSQAALVNQQQQQPQPNYAPNKRRSSNNQDARPGTNAIMRSYQRRSAAAAAAELVARDNNNGADKTPSEGKSSARINHDGQSLVGDIDQADGSGPSGTSDNWAISRTHQDINIDVNSDLLREYLLVDLEISDLEERDVLHIYHDKIEQLEQLDQELDMIRREVGAIDSAHLEDSSSIKSGHRDRSRRNTSQNRHMPNGVRHQRAQELSARQSVLDKQRDSLRQEVEAVVSECDKLQQKYRERDEILDKIFDGHFGSGLENHLEKQLDWLLEQKHYVDQVFYAWKRAETLSSQACEQFLRALEEFKRLPNVHDPIERREISKSIHELLIRSRLDMEQAQKYNPNVDAPFYTTEETEKFDRTVDDVLKDDEISVSRYNQILTVIEVAYKRAVSIKLWLEQILQTTIARDSFELAEEYRWIAIQLRKERMNLVKGRLQEPSIGNALTSSTDREQMLPQEVNRDSGVESETNEVDLSEQINRFLEDQAGTTTNTGGAEGSVPQSNGQMIGTSKVSNKGEHDEGAKSHVGADRPSHRDDTGIGLKSESAEQKSDRKPQDTSVQSKMNNMTDQNVTNPSFGQGLEGLRSQTLRSGGTKPLVNIDEELRRSVLAQVGQSHERHRSELERYRKNIQAKTSSALDEKMQQRQQRRRGEQIEATPTS